MRYQELLKLAAARIACNNFDKNAGMESMIQFLPLVLAMMGSGGKSNNSAPRAATNVWDVAGAVLPQLIQSGMAQRAQQPQAAAAAPAVPTDPIALRTMVQSMPRISPLRFVNQPSVHNSIMGRNYATSRNF